jgi:serine phosphatase RsbU (regulator of sigma subunit)/DNA-binding NarL/FixJ family response regulator
MSWENDDTLKLLVVDDEPDNLDLLYRTFRREFELYKADSGFAALDLLAEQGEMAIIISDQRMPRMNGTEFLSRTVESFPDTIRIVLTGYTDAEDLVEAINSGKVFKYITKPWDSDELKSVVSQAAETYRLIKQRTDTLTQALRRESFLNEVMHAIRKSLDYNNMLQTIASTLRQSFTADHAILYAVETSEQTLELGKAITCSEVDKTTEHWGVLEQHSLAVSQVSIQTSDRTVGTVPLNCPLTAVTIPLRYQSATLAVVTLYRQQATSDWADHTLSLLDSMTEPIALALSQARLYQCIQAQTQQMQAELAVARQIQNNLLRQPMPQDDSIRIQARCLPARAVGGDFYEIFSHPQGDIWLAVGDVSGKGVPAALLMASALSILRRELAHDPSPTPDRVMKNLNQSLWDDLVSTNCFITLALVCYRPATHELLYANAGHIYPLLWSSEQQRSPTAEPTELKTRGVPLGILPTWTAATGTIHLPHRSTLLLTSDGLTEATITTHDAASSGVMLKQTGLWKLIQAQADGLNLDQLLATIQAGRTEQEDDQTVLALEVLA